MAKIEDMRLFFKTITICKNPEKKAQVEDMAQKVANDINQPVKELIEKFKEIQYENLDDEELSRWITLQTMLPVSSLIIRTFKAIPVEKETYDIFMEKIWVAVEKSREEEENS